MRKATFRAFGRLIKGVISVHRNHDVFIQGIEQEKRLKLIFSSRKYRREVVSLCAPLHYGKGPAGPATSAEDELECYYLWDFGAEKGSNFLALSPSEIVSMGLTEEAFHVKEFYSQSNLAKKNGQNTSTLKTGWPRHR